MTCIPRINWLYWVGISIASILGANIGDYLSDSLNLGNLAGIPLELGALGLIFLSERLISRPSAIYFWLAVVVIRASATNVGDSLHTFHVGWELAVPASAVLLAACVTFWGAVRPPERNTGYVPVNGFYWATLFVAGVLGTVAGDALSYATHLGNLMATLISAVPILLLFTVGGLKGLLTDMPFYWLLVALIRTAGTAAGDFTAHSIGLEASMGFSAILYFGLIFLAYLTTDQNVRIVERPGDRRALT